MPPLRRIHTSKNAVTLHNSRCRPIIVARLAAVLELPLAPLLIAGPGGLEIRHVDAGCLVVQFDQVLLTTASATEAAAIFVDVLIGDADVPETDALDAPKPGLR